MTLKSSAIFSPLLIILFAILCGYSCQNEQPKKIPALFTPKGNYNYVHHLKNNGQTAQPGDSVVFHYCLRNGEKIINCTQTKNRPVSLKLPPENVNFSTPLFAGVSVMSEGDSITLFYPIAENAEKPRGFEDANAVIYDIKVLEIHSLEK